MKWVSLIMFAAIVAIPAWALAITRGTGITFSEPTVYSPLSSGEPSHWAVVGEFSDGYPSKWGYTDIVRIIRTGTKHTDTDFQLIAYEGLGTGQWAASGTTPFTVEPPIGDYSFVGPDHTFTGDVNGDGWLDVIVLFRFAEGSSDTQWQYLAFLNTGGTGFRCAGDIDGDGETRVEDLIYLLKDWGCEDGGA